MHRILPVVVCLAAISALAQDSGDARQLLDSANQALRRQEVRQYDALLRRAWSAPGKPEDRSEVAAALGNDLWRIQRDPVRAREILAAGRALQARPAGPQLELARLEAFEHNFAASRDAARAALAAASEAVDTRRAKVAFAMAVREEILHTELDIPAGPIPRERASLVREALELIDPVVRNEPGLAGPSRPAILLALLADDGPAALRAWRSYYHVPPGDHPLPPPLTEAGGLLAGILPSLAVESSADLRRQVIGGLAASRLYPEAAVLALRWKLAETEDNPDTIRYARWIRATQLQVDENYRLQALGKAKPADFYGLFAPRLKEIWTMLHSSGENEEFQDARCREWLRSRFGALIRVVPRAVNFGHVVRQEGLTIDQYGHTASLRYIVLDNMVSNAYTTWLWDGQASIGGWSYPASGDTPATIVEVRSDSAITAWNAVADPDTLRRNRESIERLSAGDDERARKNPSGYLPGLSLRTAQQGRQALLDRLKAQGLTGAELRATFIAEWETAHWEGVIRAHEGRHALDQSEKPGPYPLEELEYRAKLSEVTFSREPLLVFGAIFDSSIGLAGDPHGMANERIMKGLIAWMQLHTGEIEGLDSAHPLLPQFDRLTADQMRSAFRSLDPWAK